MMVQLVVRLKPTKGLYNNAFTHLAAVVLELHAKLRGGVSRSSELEKEK